MGYVWQVLHTSICFFLTEEERLLAEKKEQERQEREIKEKELERLELKVRRTNEIYCNNMSFFFRITQMETIALSHTFLIMNCKLLCVLALYCFPDSTESAGMMS